MGVAVVRQAGPVGVEELLLHPTDRKEADGDFTSDRSSAIYRDFTDDVVLGWSASRGADPGALVVLFGALAKNIIGRPGRVGERGQGGRKGGTVPIDGLRRRRRMIDGQVSVDLETAHCGASKRDAICDRLADQQEQQNSGDDQ